MRSQIQSILVVALMTLAAPAIFAADAAPATQPTPTNGQVDGVGVDEKLDAPIPLDAVFTDEKGNKVTIRDCMMQGKPAILQLSYFGCPMLCDLISQGVLKSMEDLDLNIGTDFSVINVSFDPRETSSDGYQKKKTYVERYSRAGAAEGWHFLVGEKDSIKAITSAVGFKYKWIEKDQQFAHPAVLMIIKPDGHVSRYLYGVDFPTRTLRLSLVDATAGKIGTTIDKVLLLCMHYDPTSQAYKLAMPLMRTGGVLTLLVLGTWIGLLIRREKRRSHAFADVTEKR